MTILSLVLLSFTLITSCQPELSEQSVPKKNWNDTFTLEEKIGQLIISIPPLPGDGVTLEDLLYTYHLSGFIYMNWPNDIQGMSKQEIIAYTQNLQAKSTIPLFISADIEGGEINRISQFYQLKTSQEYGLAYESTDQHLVLEQYRSDIRALALVLSELGINLNFAPVLDVERTLDNGVLSQYGRSYSTDTETVRILGEIYVAELQRNGIFATIKHFPGHGHTTCDTFIRICEVDLSEKMYRERDLPPFQSAISQHPAFAMVGLFTTPYDPGVISLHSKQVVTDLLRRELGFEGIIISDDFMMGAVKEMDRYNLTINAFQAGVDMFLTTNANDVPLIFNSLLQAVRTGVISEQSIDQSFQRIVNAKAALT